jgi:hypothetical protein
MQRPRVGIGAESSPHLFGDRCFQEECEIAVQNLEGNSANAGSYLNDRWNWEVVGEEVVGENGTLFSAKASASFRSRQGGALE